MPEIIIAPFTERSEKPEEVARRIERLFPGPYLELFARRPRRGWVTWGNEIARDAMVTPAAEPPPPPREAAPGADDIPDFLRRI
jgi:hypothetical protein